MKIVVASSNPVKVEASQHAVASMFPGRIFEIEAVSVSSRVSKQPSTHRETMRGAANRAFDAACYLPAADFSIGIEGGIEETDGQMEAFAWVVVRGHNGRIGKGKTGSFYLPEAVAQLIRAGKELGEADDMVFGRFNSKQDNGAVGILTDNALRRTEFYTHAVMLDLIPFKNPQWYP